MGGHNDGCVHAVDPWHRSCCSHANVREHGGISIISLLYISWGRVCVYVEVVDTGLRSKTGFRRVVGLVHRGCYHSVIGMEARYMFRAHNERVRHYVSDRIVEK